MGDYQDKMTASAQALMDDPASFFGHSATEMHSIAPDRLAALQLRALQLRFEAQREAIPMVKKLADNQGVATIEAIDDIVPVLFQHTMYKSYPASLLSGRRFDQLTRWLDKLTSVDLSGVDVSACDSIDTWLDALATQTALDPFTTSGTTGTMSFIPKSKRDWTVGFASNRVTDLQSFGTPPTEAQISGDYHVIWPIYADGHLASFRGGHYYKQAFGNGRDDHFHPLYRQAGSADLMWLAAQMRVAAARGDAGQVDVPESLLARRAELEGQQADMASRQGDFILELSQQLRGERVYCMYPSYPLYQVAAIGLERGLSCEFAAGSVIGSAGGAKGMPVPDDWVEQVRRFFGVERVERYYGMSELTGLHKQCSHDRYHFQPWAIPFLLDPDSGALLPRSGVQKGRAAFFDLLQQGNWGGLVTGDEVEIDFDGGCGCGQSSAHMSTHIERYSDKRGDDKITCAGTPQAHADALEYLVAFK